ncbi:MAG: AbrB/MazE/SpoVT family DNA-binding domain-containing protein [Eggerthellaceae bacterium]
MGERGQIVIPKKAREVFNLTPGSELLVLGDESQGIALQSVENVLSSFEPFIGAIKAAQKRISPEEDNQSL